MEHSLNHLNACGEVHMVDVGDKPSSLRQAVAEGCLLMQAQTLSLVLEGQTAKGDVLAVARVAAIQAAKHTWELIPLCHPIPLSGIEVTISPLDAPSGLRVEVHCRTQASTGVEMEALTAVSLGLLTLYDMLKSVDPGMSIHGVQLLQKNGGQQGSWRREAGRL